MTYMRKLILLATLGLTIGTWAQTNQKQYEANKNLTIYNDVLRQLETNYVDTIDHKDLVETSIAAMLRKIDPYTVYIPESKTDDLKFMTTGEYGGIGSAIIQSEGKIWIAEPYEGMPAHKNGLLAGDIILEVDGKSTKGKTVSEVSTMLRGIPHSKLKITLEREGVKRAIKKEFEREKIQINPVPYASVISPGIGYIKLNEFTDKAAVEVRAALQKMVSEEQIESVVLDLRNNGGGIIDEAIKIVGYFVPKGTEVVSTRGKTKQATRTYKTTTEPIFPKMQIAVLIGSNSASASEIVAGAFQDLDRGVLIGERTFGKGLVQSIRPIRHDGYLKVTTSKYYIPSGRCIQAIDYSNKREDGSVGVVPDSLTTLFYTKKRRPVRDGGGVSPDIQSSQEGKVTIAYYLYAQNMFFHYASKFQAEHPTIAPASEFEFTDEEYTRFEAYLMEKNFSYKTETERYFSQLEEMAKYEGIDLYAGTEMAALKEKLTPSLSDALAMHKKEVTEILSTEIVKRYYHQKGAIIYQMRFDPEVKKAVETLNDTDYMAFFKQI